MAKKPSKPKTTKTTRKRKKNKPKTSKATSKPTKSKPETSKTPKVLAFFICPKCNRNVPIHEGEELSMYAGIWWQKVENILYCNVCPTNEVEEDEDEQDKHVPSAHDDDIDTGGEA